MDKWLERLWYYVWSGLTVNVGTKIVSVMIAIVLWVIVLGSRNVEMNKEIPLELITPADLVVSNEIPDKITFRLSGPQAFLRALLDRRDAPIRVNLAGAKPGLVTYRFFSDNIRDLPIGVKVLSINPTAILIKLEYLKRREVPVRLVMQGSPAEGYRVSKAMVKPGTVRIKGSESHVDAITELPTLPVDLDGAHQSFDREVALDLARYNVELDSGAPKAYVSIEPLAANYRIKNVDIRVLSPYKVRLNEKTVTILVRADPNQLSTLDKGRVYAEIDMRGKPRGKYSEPVKVTLPDDVGLVKVLPERVRVTLY